MPSARPPVVAGSDASLATSGPDDAGRDLDLTIAICTRDRARDLVRAMSSLVTACARLDAAQRRSCEVLVVDDGHLPSYLHQRFANQLAICGVSYRHRNKSERPGLLLSRREAVSLARGRIILFTDDDIEMHSDYLVRLLELYRRQPGLAGAGGIDSLGRPQSRLRSLGEVLAGIASPRCGRLSLSGYNGDSPRWPRRSRPFITDYLVGFNMSFRTAALAGLEAQPWLTGYSLGEDIYLSLLARRHGPLLLDPRLRVRHHQSPSTFRGRDDHRRYFHGKIVNHARLLRVAGAGPLRYLAFAYSATLFLSHHLATHLVASVLRHPRRTFTAARAAGTWSGVATLLAAWLRERHVPVPPPGPGAVT